MTIPDLIAFSAIVVWCLFLIVCRLIAQVGCSGGGRDSSSSGMPNNRADVRVYVRNPDGGLAIGRCCCITCQFAAARWACYNDFYDWLLSVHGIEG